MQTKGHQQFRITWQVIVILFLCLVALALPLGGVILMLQGLAQSRASQGTVPDASGALQSRLEGIVDEQLAPENTPVGEPKIVLFADDLGREKARINTLVASVGGTWIPRSESETEVRLLIQVPPERLEEFLLACCGKERVAVGDASGGLVEVVIRKVSSQ
ncbi:MAG TPA: hypothetical protein VFO90_07920 [Terrimicrobiaceae bacterium]|nr:hypothetical protein [Terrimicrobiaceae bacterium]